MAKAENTVKDVQSMTCRISTDRLFMVLNITATDGAKVSYRIPVQLAPHIIGVQVKACEAGLMPGQTPPPRPQ